MKFSFVSILSLVAIQCAARLVNADDCFYNPCVWKFNPVGEHAPCGSGTGKDLVRSVDCNDGNTIHICCTLPYRDDIQKSRQIVFRAVTWVADGVSRACALRVLCEQACKDGLEGSDARSDYPEVLPDDNPANKDYVQAYNAGESFACFKETNADDPHAYDERACEIDCRARYPSCDAEMANSLITKAFYKFARIIHKFGLWSFSAYWLVRDKFSDLTNRIMQRVKEALEEFLDRMAYRLWAAFLDWLLEHGSASELVNGVPSKAGSSKSVDEEWVLFLVSYNATDSELVERVHDVLNSTSFYEMVTSTNETLKTGDFDHDDPALVVAEARLPLPSDSLSVVFDRADSIYVLGGEAYGGVASNFVVKYSISEGTVEQVGTFEARRGGAILDAQGNVFYFGGVRGGGVEGDATYESSIWKFPSGNPDARELIGHLPESCADFSLAFDEASEQVYIFGGSCTLVGGSLTWPIFKFSTVTYDVERVGRMPVGNSVRASAIGTSDGAYIFGGFSPASSAILQYSWGSEGAEPSRLNVSLPYPLHACCAVWTGSEVFVIGGVGLGPHPPSVMRFNPISESVDVVTVDNFPTGLAYLSSSCVFIPRLGRIYIFGGFANSKGYTSEIRYFDVEQSLYVKDQY